MSIVLKQTARTTTSVSFSTTGFPQYKDKKTYVWITTLDNYDSSKIYVAGSKIMYGGNIYGSIQSFNWSRNPESNPTWWHLFPLNNWDFYGTMCDTKWVDLAAAKDQGYLSNYTIDVAGDNGTITVTPPTSKIEELKVWQFLVAAFDNGNYYDCTNQFSAILKFEWDNTYTKVAGNAFDVTANDFIRLYKFTLYIGMWAANLNSMSVPYPNSSTVYASDLRGFAQGIKDAATALSASMFTDVTSGRSDVIATAQNLINNCYSGDDLYAAFFIAIKNIINIFNLKSE